MPFGGTIVNVNHVVTSCGVVLNNQNQLLALDQYFVRFGSNFFNDATQTPVTAVFPHPQYDPWTFNHDIAVLRVSLIF